MKKNILHLIDSFGVGGAEKLLVTVINHLDPEKYEQHLILLSKPDTLLPQLTAPCRVTILDFNSYRDLLRMKKNIKQYIRDNSIDIVHAQLFWSNIVSRMATKRAIPVFNTIQAISSEASYKINRKSLYIEKLTYRKRHHIIGVSSEVLNDFDKWVGLKGASTVLYNVIDDKFFAASPKKHFSEKGLKMVAVGNLRWQKNYPYLLEAFKKMPEGVSLDIYGEGELRPEFQKIIDEHKLPVKLCGQRNNLHEILASYDLFVMSSLYEGFSLGLMEGMASGLPALLSDVPVLKEAGGDSAMYFSLVDTGDIIHKVNGILANPQTLAAWADKGWNRAIALAKKDQYLRKLEGLYKASLSK